MGKAIQTAVVKVLGVLDPSVAKAVNDANKKFTGLKKGVVIAGVALASATTAAAAFGKTALDSAKTFETGMANIATLLDGDANTVNKRIAEMGDDIMGVAKKTGLATDDLSNGMYQIVSALGDSKDATSQLEVAAKAAKAGGATTVDAINLLSAVTKGYGDTSGEAWSKASDLAFQTVKLGQTSFPELAANMGKVVPIAAALNISQEELFGSFATLTGVTGSTAEVSTQLKAVFSGLMTPSKQLTETINGLGYESAAAMLNQEGLIGTLDKLTAACGDDKMAVSKLFTSVEAQTAILALAGSQTENWITKSEAMASSADATSKAFDTATNNLQGKLDKMKQVFETFKIKVGNILLPIVSDIVDKLLPQLEQAFTEVTPVIAKAFEGAKPILENIGAALPGLIKLAVAGLQGLLFVLNPIIDTLEFLGNNITWILPIVSGLAAGLGILTLAFKLNKLATAISAKGLAGWVKGLASAEAASKLMAGAQTVLNAVMAANPIGLIVAAVVALGVAFFVLYKKCEPFRNFINGIGEAIKNGFLKAVDFIKSIPAKIMGFFNLIINFVKNNWAGIALFIVNPFAGAFKLLYDNCEGFRNAINNFVGSIKNIFGGITQAFSNIITSISEKFPFLGSIFSAIKTLITPYIDGIKNAISSIKTIFSNIIDFVKNVFTGNWSAAWENVKNIFGSIWGGLKGLVKAPINGVISLVNMAISGLNKLQVNIPDWVPLVGGKSFGVNIPQIPMLATGGIATSPSICGEGGYPEYVISTDPKYREQNKQNVIEAAKAIGALNTANSNGASVRNSLNGFNSKGTAETVNNRNEAHSYKIEFSPIINISGNTNNARSIADEVMRVFDDYQGELADKIKAVLATAREGSYGI